MTNSRTKKPVEAKAAILPPELSSPLAFVVAGHHDGHVSEFYQSDVEDLERTVADVYGYDSGDIYVYKLVPYAVLEEVPARYKVKE